jgi:hypothetical protein
MKDAGPIGQLAAWPAHNDLAPARSTTERVITHHFQDIAAAAVVRRKQGRRTSPDGGRLVCQRPVGRAAMEPAGAVDARDVTWLMVPAL